MKFKSLKTVFVLLILASTLNVNLIHSQTTQRFSTDNFDLDISIDFEPSFFKESRSVRYREINEMLRYAKAYENMIEQDSLHKVQIEQQNKIIKSQDSILNSYENVIIPTFESEIQSKDYQLELRDIEIKKSHELFELRKEAWRLKFDKYKSKRLSLGLGGSYGLGDKGTGFNAGINFQYTFFRF